MPPNEQIPAPGPTAESLSAARSIPLGVLTNWAWSFLVALSGFLIPRLIADYEGREVLGIWDLGWSLLFFVSFLSFGATGAVNRYVSRYRTLEDWHSLNASVNCSLLLLSLSAAGTMLIAGTMVAFIPDLFADFDGPSLAAARAVVLLLALAAASQLPLAVFNSVITGHGRFDLLNLTRGAKDFVVLLAMVAVIVMGWGIVALAAVVVAGELCCGISQWIVARRLCPRLRISLRFVSRKMLRKVLSFGGKSMSRGISRAMLYQVNSILVATFLGPATLAVYQRQRNLVMQVMKFVKQYAQVYIPVSGVLDAKKDVAGLQQLMLESGRWGMLVAAPMMILLILLGGPLVNVWMGPGFASPGVLAVLAAGHLISVSQLGPQSVLEGMGRHGRPALMELAAAVVGVTLTALLTGVLGFGMMGAAVSIAFAVGISTGVVLPVYACRLLEFPAVEYARSAMLRPLALQLPFLLWLLLVRTLWSDRTGFAIGMGLGGGVILLGFTYWKFALSSECRCSLIARIRSILDARRGTPGFRRRTA
jgi:O-antigen/teichoic acid export membrane protein